MYKEIFNPLSIDKNTDYKKQASELKNKILYTIWDKFTQGQDLTEINY